MSDVTFDSRTKALMEMRGAPYEPPAVNHKLSHLTHDRAFKDYKYADARKLIKQQEDLLRNLGKVRENMELEEHIIGRTRDFYAGSRQEKYGHTMGRAEKLKRQREKQREREREELSEYIVDVAADNSYGGDEQEAKFHDEIQRLRSQVNTIANRYQETDGRASPMKYAYEPEYYPGASYTRGLVDSEAGYKFYTDANAPSTAPAKYLEADGCIYKLVASK